MVQMPPTFILTSETRDMTLETLLSRAAGQPLDVHNEHGELVLRVMPNERLERAYAEARGDAVSHREEIRAALARKGGSTTQQILEKLIAIEQSEQEASRP